MTAATFTQAQRDKMAGGAAMSDGSYPINNQAQLHDAIMSLGRSGPRMNAVKAHIKKRAAALGLTKYLQEHTSWAK